MLKELDEDTCLGEIKELVKTIVDKKVKLFPMVNTSFLRDEECADSRWSVSCRRGEDCHEWELVFTKEKRKEPSCPLKIHQKIFTFRFLEMDVDAEMQYDFYAWIFEDERLLLPKQKLALLNKIIREALAKEVLEKWQP